MSRLAVALAFLTRLPAPVRAEAGAREVGRAMLFFPAVGAALGAVLAAAGLLLVRALPPPLAAILVVALGTAMTGALHLDGLADTADGLGGGRNAEDALRIMRDHAVGAYGAAALVLALLVKVAAIAALLSRPGAAAWLPLAGALSRWVLVPVARLAPSARPDGLGASVAAHVGPPEVAGATALALGVALGLAGVRGAVAWATVALAGAAFAGFCRRRIGGMTGDTLGATGELAEALVLVLGVGLAAP
ncbi:MULTISPECIES: adenosylcobinamide-GDP ribazoletransferase [Anaeromyxobacter]|uniref:adenosylcobinamide-GDP ribazoletransferase n=1 Tax=Anaeromyxobacter TaxID=161492 RepID=UPI001F5A9659|nr:MULTISPECIES: adenosylcobinamide-GDP ribazoletransferase [unclassified Anaeromyxobacter]